jgi:inositol-hexakisphosphate kinase
MSRSPEPDHAAPTTTVRPAQDADNKNTQHVFPSRRPRDALSSRATSSTSLLTQALAGQRTPADYPSSATGDILFSTKYLNQSISRSPGTEKQWLPNGRRLDTNSNSHFSANKMATIAPASVADMRATVSLGASPITSEFTLRDLENFDAIFANHRQFFNRTRGRGTSLERTDKEKRVQEVPKGTFSTNLGDLGMTTPPPAVAQAAEDPISSNIPVEGPRAEYRSWRDARSNKPHEKAWSIGKQGNKDSHGGGQVEKSITEALAGFEHNTRSRKASHSLGFFKEGLPEDKLKRRDTKSRGRSKDNNSGPKTPVEQERGKQREGNVIRENATVQSVKSSTKSALQSPLEQDEDLALRAKDLTLHPTNTFTDEEGYFDVTHTIPRDSVDEIRQLPSQLLAEIRKHHNLTPGAPPGTSFSRSIPVTASERATPSNGGPPQVDEKEDDDDRELTLVKSNDDEDDSGEEQISSALFVPHHTPHESPERPRDEACTKENKAVPDIRRLARTPSQQWLEEHEVPSNEVDEKYMESDVKSRRPQFAGGAHSHKFPVAAEQDQHSTSDISDLEQDSYDDAYYISTGDESSYTDDPDTTPTGSPHRFHPHKHDLASQRKPSQPLEAIELIPYRHQVGGHTTMWRFSKRAVCKQLNNRENEFYEQVERHHPKLLNFLPRCVQKFFIASSRVVFYTKSYQLAIANTFYNTKP